MHTAVFFFARTDTGKVGVMNAGCMMECCVLFRDDMFRKAASVGRWKLIHLGHQDTKTTERDVSNSIRQA